ncbi:MAG: hypothetical protein MUC54_01810 [Chloroflexi bacterium]|jgi:hypothetical protein|nr:hypothetical protein [Chloroflexota bacterium]
MTDPARETAGAAPVRSTPPPAPLAMDKPDCPDPGLPGERPGVPGQPPGHENGGCSQAQLRRFVKSRPYVPLHELRRRFGIGGTDDEVSPLAVDGRMLFVGLPEREAAMVGELIRMGDAGYELLLDPVGPMIVGVWPTRPVQRS